MKAVLLQGYGDTSQFVVEDVPAPAPGAGEVLIEVEASAVNHIDLFVRQGFFAEMMPLEFPAILGGDAAGTVAAVGADVEGFAVGDRVIAHIGITGKGAHAEFVVAPVAGVAKLPDNVSFEQGATLPLVGLTGRQAVDTLGVKRGDRVLVGGALGAVGRVAVQYLKELGAVPVAGVQSADLEEGRAIAGEALDIDKTPDEASFDYAVAASQPSVANTIANVRPGGKIGSAVGIPEDADSSKTYETIMHHDDPMHLQGVANAAGNDELTIPIAATFGLEQLGEAHAALAAGPRGKIVIVH